MSDPTVFWLLAAMLALVVVLGAGALVLRHRARQLQRLLAVSQEKLEQLQRQFEHFVPADVVEQLTGGPGIYAPRRCGAKMPCPPVSCSTTSAGTKCSN